MGSEEPDHTAHASIFIWALAVRVRFAVTFAHDASFLTLSMLSKILADDFLNSIPNAP